MEEHTVGRLVRCLTWRKRLARPPDISPDIQKKKTTTVEELDKQLMEKSREKGSKGRYREQPVDWSPSSFG